MLHVRLCLAVVLLAVAGQTFAERLVFVDDTGHEVVLDAPAKRIVSLAPSITELLFSAGAGEHIVAAVDYSDHPPAAADIPRIGSSERLNLEAILDFEPDLVIGWDSGNPRHQVGRLRELGVPVYMTEARQPADIARTLRRLGRLAGTDAVAEQAAGEFVARFATLRAVHGERERVGVFYQIWNDPLMTVNGEHMISAIIRGCGGYNVFEDLSSLAPRVDVEAVLARDPDAIIASGSDAGAPGWLDDWREWPELRAVRRDNIYSIPPDIIQRQTPRILEAMELMCEQIERARGRQ